MRNDSVGGKTFPTLLSHLPARRKKHGTFRMAAMGLIPTGRNAPHPGISTNAAGVFWEACGIGNALLCYAVYFTAILSMRF